MLTILAYLVTVVNLVNLVHLGMYVVGANIYDIRSFAKRAKPTSPAPPRRRPLVSVVVPAHNEEVGVIRTLESVRKSTYRPLEIIVVENNSTDRTTSVVRRYIRYDPTLRKNSFREFIRPSSPLARRFVQGNLGGIRVTLVSQSEQGKATAMNNGIKNYARGQLIMCLDADSTLQSTAVENAVKYFDDPSIMGIAANVRVIESNSLLGTLQRFEHMIGYRSKKFYTLTNSEFIVGGVASTYRSKVLRQVGGYDTDTLTEDIGLSIKLLAANGNRKQRIVYAPDVVGMTEGVQTYRALMRQRYRWKMGSLQNLLKYRRLIGRADRQKFSYMLTLYRLPMALLSELILLLEPLVLGYVLYLSIHYRTPWIFVGAYVTITLYILWTLWPDEHLTTKQKLVMSVQALEMYVLFYAMDVVQMNAIFRCLWNQRQIRYRTNSSNWTSPARSGLPVRTTS